MTKTYKSYEHLLRAIEDGEEISNQDSVMVEGIPVQLRPIIQKHCLPGSWRNKNGWVPKKPWLAFHTVQWGDWSTTGNAFFEVFSDMPDTFVRGEGKTVEEAEQAAWTKLVRAARCPEHEFERRDYRNGAGFCKHCGMFKSKAFEPLEKCVICGVPCYYSRDTEGNWYCEDHVDQIPDDKASESLKWARRERNNPTEITSEDIKDAINSIAKRLKLVGDDIAERESDN